MRSCQLLIDNCQSAVARASAQKLGGRFLFGKLSAPSLTKVVVRIESRVNVSPRLALQ